MTANGYYGPMNLALYSLGGRLGEVPLLHEHSLAIQTLKQPLDVFVQLGSQTRVHTPSSQMAAPPWK